MIMFCGPLNYTGPAAGGKGATASDSQT